MRRLVLCVLLCLWSVGGMAQTTVTPSLLNFQGRLTKPDGTPILDSSASTGYSIRFSLWDAATAGTERWNQTIPNVAVKNGVFSVLLNLGSSAETILNGNVYLEIKVGNGAPLTPRQQLVSVAYALKANTVPDNAITPTKLNSDPASLSRVSGGVLKSESGRLGVNLTMAPQYPLHVGPKEGIFIGQNPAAGGYTGLELSLMGNGYGYARLQGIRASGIAWGDIVLNERGGNVGIGLNYPLSRLGVAGVIESTTGGFKFPDGSVQTSAFDLPINRTFNSASDIFTLSNANTFGTTMVIRNTGGGYALRSWGNTAIAGYGDRDINSIGVFGDGGNMGKGIFGHAIGTGFAGYFDGRVQVTGRTITGTLQITGGSDVAEPFDVREQDKVRPGLVVSIDAQKVGALRLANRSYDRAVAGIVSGAKGINPGMTLTQTGTEADGKHPIAMAGRVWCWCDADKGGAIQPGDLLTTSGTPGHAMRVADYRKAQGAVLGKAMSTLKRGKGLVLVLVRPQ